MISRHRKSVSGRRAFTLIELLVVITIIGVLVATLLPVLGKARYHAMVVVDNSQMRQHGVGFNAYANDFKFYYPLFGGAIQDVGGGRTGTPNWGTFLHDATVFNTFGNYIGLPNNTAVSSLAKIKYCPLVQWYPFGQFSFINPFFTPYWAGAPGYNFYTGRCLTGSTWANFNTVVRRNDPKEILMTDQLMNPTQEEDWRPSGWGMQVSASQAGWFNPHYARSAQPRPMGEAGHLAADGHVVNLDFSVPANNTYISAYYAISYFTGVVVGPPTSLVDGPYAALR